MIVVTGAAGFIASVVVGKLNAKGYTDLVLVDDFTRLSHRPNYTSKTYRELIHRDNFLEWARQNATDIQAIIHLGARTDTAEQSVELFNRLNLHYSQHIWQLCTEFQIPLIYASSAATYGAGELGFSDDHSYPQRLSPQNPYGRSKNDFDCWVLQQPQAPFFWAGLKFFNVYGPNEYHKQRMASVIFHAFHQIRNTQRLKLFRSHRPEYADGFQKRDFVYVKDVADVILFLLENRPQSAIYNLGSGKARPFMDLGVGVFRALGLEPAIDFVDIPADIRNSYQYFTEAEMQKLRNQGYTQPFTELEAGITDYVQNYLLPNVYL